ncbi:MAG: hypothetical protein JWM88_1344 [Verrucomicrobia bacterium]|nr:hypothetical protein [Verrucomicrobiota bacterium]
MTTPISRSSVCDFDRSFLRWRNDTLKKPMLTVSRPPPTTLNNVRMPLECLATVSRDGRQEEFGLGASCKTEQVFVERDVWMQPNADMCAVMGADQFMVIKRWDKADKGEMLFPPSLGVQPERQCVDPNLAFETHSLALRRCAALQLGSIHEVIETLASDRRVVSRTTVAIEGGEVTLEYPVKTVNYSERHGYYQVDTGPVLFPAEPTGPGSIEQFHLAYVAHLGGEWAEFLVSRPTPLADLPVAVHHFSESRRIPARNSLWAIEGDVT